MNSPDVFISHASADKKRYVDKLASALSKANVSFWLDSNEIEWGDNVANRINDGLAKSKFGLVCFSSAFLQRPWPENEVSALLGLQSSSRTKKMLPLVLNSKALILKRYPLIQGIAYREFSVGPHKLADEIASIVRRLGGGIEVPVDQTAETEIAIEGVHTGKLKRIKVPAQATVHVLIAAASSELGDGTREFPVSDYENFRIRWVLVDRRLAPDWKALPRHIKQKVYGLFVSNDGNPVACFSEFDRLTSFKLNDETVFHLYAIEDIDFEPPPLCAV